MTRTESKKTPVESLYNSIWAALGYVLDELSKQDTEEADKQLSKTRYLFYIEEPPMEFPSGLTIDQRHELLTAPFRKAADKLPSTSRKFKEAVDELVAASEDLVEASDTRPPSTIVDQKKILRLRKALAVYRGLS